MGKILNVELQDVQNERALIYYMSVCLGRALCNFKDGLKPVQRRILYAMHEGGFASNKSHVKLNKITGDVIGKQK